MNFVGLLNKTWSILAVDGQDQHCKGEKYCQNISYINASFSIMFGNIPLLELEIILEFSFNLHYTLPAHCT